MQPTIGRMVHFTGCDEEGGCTGPYAAIVTKVHPATENDVERVDLVTFGPQSIYFQLQVQVAFSAEPTPLFWSWPPRV